MKPDTLIVMTQSLSRGRDLLPFWTGLAGAALGIIGTAIASTVAYKIAKRQLGAQRELATAQIDVQRATTERELRATIVASNRIRWMEQLRTEVAGYIAIVDSIDPSNKDKLKEQLDKAVHHVAMVSLLLPASEDTTKAFFAATKKVGETFSSAKTPQQKSDEMHEALRKVADAARAILKAEWRRVKQLE